MITLWGVLGNGRRSGRRRIQSPVQVSPELLLVLRMDQFIHTLVHDVRLREKKKKHNERKNLLKPKQTSYNTIHWHIHHRTQKSVILHCCSSSLMQFVCVSFIVIVTGLSLWLHLQFGQFEHGSQQQIQTTKGLNF